MTSYRSLIFNQIKFWNFEDITDRPFLQAIITFPLNKKCVTTKVFFKAITCQLKLTSPFVCIGEILR
ncbi:hypothetical protein RO07_12405 [Pandoraea pulmonicola]|uniref:Uncharacterized protein n=1 Tax=Pandoraea pulmonicola TaxID=93221 RepID=A0ABM5S005_PANPU|nr:hypothetical protein RO07_12405 [Pandoraea pulmonicola]